MAFILLIAGYSESKLIVAFLLGTGLLFIFTFIIVGIFLMYHMCTPSDLSQGKGVFIRLQNIQSRVNSAVHARCAFRGSLAFICLGMVSTAIFLVLIALAVPCLCLGKIRELDFFVVALVALVFLAVGFGKRKET